MNYIEDPWALNLWKSIENYKWKSQICFNRTSETSFQHLQDIHCKCICCWENCPGRLVPYKQKTKGPLTKESCVLQDSTVQLRPSGISSQACILENHASVYLEAFWTISTSNFLRIIIKFIHTHHCREMSIARSLDLPITTNDSLYFCDWLLAL